MLCFKIWMQIMKEVGGSGGRSSSSAQEAWKQRRKQNEWVPAWLYRLTKWMRWVCEHESLQKMTSAPATLMDFSCLLFAAALEFVKDHPQDPMSQKEFDEACGVGVVITPEQIEEGVSAWAYMGQKHVFFTSFIGHGVFSDGGMLCRWRKLSRSTRNSC